MPTATDLDPPMLVACLCAQWCGTCRDYAAVFAQVQAGFPSARFVPIDIEDEADLLDGVEIENFPTLLIARGDRLLFFGTITPHAQTLARLVQTALADALPPPAADAAIDALALRVSAWCRHRTARAPT
jgi:thioredoxin 1